MFLYQWIVIFVQPTSAYSIEASLFDDNQNKTRQKTPNKDKQDDYFLYLMCLFICTIPVDDF